MKRAVKVIMVIALVVVALVGPLTYFVVSHAVSRTGFDYVAKGMTQDRVQEIVGVPHSIGRAADLTVFFYGGFRQWKWWRYSLEQMDVSQVNSMIIETFA